MNGNLIITIGRQCGSGGLRIGKELAKAMGVKCYDKELLSLAAKHSGLCEELFETHDEKPCQGKKQNQHRAALADRGYKVHQSGKCAAYKAYDYAAEDRIKEYFYHAPAAGQDVMEFVF